MKPLAVLLLVFAPLLGRAAGQEFVLSAGQSIVFIFDTLPSALSAERGDFSDIDVNSYSLTDPWVDNFRLEVFETSLDEAPRYVVTKREPNEPFRSGPEHTTSCGGTNLWKRT